MRFQNSTVQNIDNAEDYFYFMMTSGSVKNISLTICAINVAIVPFCSTALFGIQNLVQTQEELS
jgi:hypothetical protein